MVTALRSLSLSASPNLPTFQQHPHTLRVPSPAELRKPLLLLQTPLQLLAFLLQGHPQALDLPFSLLRPSGTAPRRLPGQLQLLAELQEGEHRLCAPRPGAGTAATLPVPPLSISPSTLRHPSGV